MPHWGGRPSARFRSAPSRLPNQHRQLRHRQGRATAWPTGHRRPLSATPTGDREGRPVVRSWGRAVHLIKSLWPDFRRDIWGVKGAGSNSSTSTRNDLGDYVYQFSAVRSFAAPTPAARPIRLVANNGRLGRETNHLRARLSGEHVVEARIPVPFVGAEVPPENGFRHCSVEGEDLGASAKADVLAPPGSQLPVHNTDRTARVTLEVLSKRFAADNPNGLAVPMKPDRRFPRAVF